MQIQRTLNVHGRVFELRKDATDPSQSFPYQLVTPLNAGCTKINDNSFCCWVRGIIMPRQGTIEKPMEVVGLGFSNVPIPDSQIMHISTVQSMHFYVASDESFMQDFANAFLGVQSVGGGQAQSQPVALTPFPSQEQPKVAISPIPTPAVANKQEQANAQAI